MQSIFRPAALQEMLGEHSGSGRRDGGLKMLCIKLPVFGPCYLVRGRTWKNDRRTNLLHRA
jgi:hypothetical protein